MGNPKYHTFDECLVKVKAIKTLLEQIRRASTEPDPAARQPFILPLHQFMVHGTKSGLQ